MNNKTYNKNHTLHVEVETNQLSTLDFQCEGQVFKALHTLFKILSTR